MRFFCEWMLAMTATRRGRAAAARRTIARLVPARHRPSRAAKRPRRRPPCRLDPAAAGSRRQHGDLLDRDRALADRRARARDRRLELLRHERRRSRRSRSRSRSRTCCAQLFADCRAVRRRSCPCSRSCWRRAASARRFRLASTLFFADPRRARARSRRSSCSPRRLIMPLFTGDTFSAELRSADGRPLAGAVPDRGAARRSTACSSGSSTPTTTSRSRRSRRWSGTS